MPPRKDRIAVVLDTNILIAFYLGRNSRSAISRIIHLWRNLRKIQLIISQEVLSEYIEVLKRIGISEGRTDRLKVILLTSPIVTLVNTGKVPKVARDSDDDLILAAAIAGKARYLITNDRDLLDISAEDRKRFKFEILRPIDFLGIIDEK